MADSEQYKSANEAAQDASDSAKRAEDAFQKTEELLKKVQALVDGMGKPQAKDGEKQYADTALGRTERRIDQKLEADRKETDERHAKESKATKGAGRGTPIKKENPTGQPPVNQPPPGGQKNHDTPFLIKFEDLTKNLLGATGFIRLYGEGDGGGPIPFLVRYVKIFGGAIIGISDGFPDDSSKPTTWGPHLFTISYFSPSTEPPPEVPLLPIT